MDRYKKLCVYFIYQLLQKKLVEEEKMWSQLEKLFIDKNGKPMKGGLKKKKYLVHQGDSNSSNYLIFSIKYCSENIRN